MIKKFLPKSDFSKNVLTLMTGTTVAQAIPIAISPILTRIYTPKDFGVFALYMSIASILSVIATGRYELAIMLPKKDADAVNIVVLSILISCFVSFTVLLIVWFYNNEITLLLENQEISNWLYFIPVSILLTGIYQSFNYWNNRKKEYKRIATSRVAQRGTTASANIAMGFGGLGSGGLIIGSVLGQGVAAAVLGNKIFKKNFLFFKKSINKLKIVVLSKKYKNFPKINLIHSLFNNFSVEMPVLLLNKFFGSKTVGFYSFSYKIIGLPISFASGSVSNVFYQKMSSSEMSKQDKVYFFQNIRNKLLLYSFIPSLLMFVYAKDFFKFVFGSQWIIAGIYAQIMIPMLYIRFVGSILSVVVLIYDQQKKALIIEIVNFILRAVSLLIGGIFFNSLIALMLFSVSSSIVSLYRLYWYLKIVKGL